jgi:hypothetical protein
MNKDEVLKMPAGYEIDALVLASVFGVMAFRDNCGRPYKIGFFQENEPVPNYSGDMSSAWAVVEKILDGNRDIAIRSSAHGWHVTIETKFFEYVANAETIPLAICQAALLTVIPVTEGGV